MARRLIHESYLSGRAAPAAVHDHDDDDDDDDDDDPLCMSSFSLKMSDEYFNLLLTEAIR